MITLEDLKDFDVWKQWKNGEVEIGEFQTKPGFIEKRIKQMIHIGADDECEQFSDGMSDDDIANWKHGFVHGANWMLKSKGTL
jgi:hypothetical protein